MRLTIYPSMFALTDLIDPWYGEEEKVEEKFMPIKGFSMICGRVIGTSNELEIATN